MVPDEMYPWLRPYRDREFSPRIFFGRPPIENFDSEGKRKRVCVIGGGIAGLTAAYELTQLRHEVTLLEASSRLGGRIVTSRWDDGSYGEFGPMRIPEDHLGTLHYAEKVFHLKKRDFVPANAYALLALRGHEPVQLDEYEDVLSDRYPEVRNGFKVRGVPHSVLTALIRQAMDPVDRKSLWDLYEGRLLDQALNNYERISLWQYIEGMATFRIQGSRFPNISPHEWGRVLANISADEWEFVGRSTGMTWMEQVSMLDVVVEAGSLQAKRLFELEGGMEGLVDGFRGKLEHLFHLDSRVTRLNIRTDSVDVTWRTAGEADQTGSFHYVVCAIPAPAAAKIRFEPNGALDAEKYEALTNVSYHSSAKALVRCRTRIWEQGTTETSKGFAGGGSFTDLPIQQCWYPSDNAERDSDSAAIAFLTEEDPSTAPGIESLPSGWKPKDSNVSAGRGVLCAAYLWGRNAQRWIALSDAERSAVVLDSLEHLHPGIGALVDSPDQDIRHHVWDAHAVPGQGAFAHFRPGEFRRYQLHLCRPLPEAQNPRITFAGEHIGVLHGWMQSSIQTAWAAIVKVISAPSPP